MGISPSEFSNMTLFEFVARRNAVIKSHRVHQPEQVAAPPVDFAERFFADG